MAIALEESPGIQVDVVLDERSAAFRAIGRARASGRPVVCVSTSGTAAANYLPAVVEADQSAVPVLLLTADRPPELRHVDANQTIDQVGLFGNRVRWFCDVGIAEVGFDGNEYWRSTISQAIARALGHGGLAGPVHLNLSFREPTSPVSDDGRALSPPYDFPIDGRPGGAPWHRTKVAHRGAVEIPALNRARGLLVVGEGADRPGELVAAAEKLGWPVLATALSGARGPGCVTSYHHLLVDGVPHGLEPEAVVTVGRVGPSDRLRSLESAADTLVRFGGRWHDPLRQATHMVQGDAALTLEAIDPHPDSGWTEAWTSVESGLRPALDRHIYEFPGLSGPGIARSLSDISWGALSVASSMPIRDVDAHLLNRGPVFSNRGASGIDGFLSTTLGIAGYLGRVVGFSGDLSFLHDISGLAHGDVGDVVFVVMDNRGGGLFDLLPQARFAPSYERLFVAPHERDIAELAMGLGTSAVVVDAVQDLKDQVVSRLDSGGAHVVVAPVDREADLKHRRVLDEVASDNLTLTK